MGIDWILIWTALGVVALVVGGIGGLIRRADQSSVDGRFESMDKKLDSINTQMVEKAHKDEVSRIEARFERDIADLRLDQKTGFAEIRADIKDMRADLMSAIRDAIK